MQIRYESPNAKLTEWQISTVSDNRQIRVGHNSWNNHTHLPLPLSHHVECWIFESSNSIKEVTFTNAGPFIMFSVITNIYNKKTKGPTLMEFFTATGKLKKFFFTTRDVRCVHQGWHGTHRYDIQVLATHASPWCNRGFYCRSYCLQLENHSTKYHRQQPLCNTLALLMMGIVVPETCWASNKICNKNLYCI